MSIAQRGDEEYTQLVKERQAIRVRTEIMNEQEKKWQEDMRQMQSSIEGLQTKTRDLYAQNDWYRKEVYRLTQHNHRLQNQIEHLNESLEKQGAHTGSGTRP